MAVYPNGRYLSSSPARHFGTAPGGDIVYRRMGGARLNCFLGEEFDSGGSVPDGYSLKGIVPPLNGCNLSTYTPAIAVSASGTAINGKVLEGSWTSTVTAAGGVSLIITCSGSAQVATFSGSGALSGVVVLSGAGTWAIDSDANLNLLVTLSGSGTWELEGTADMRMKLSLSGEWTPFTELSPENLASAVWSALAEDYNESGTMGAKLNSASSAGDPWTAEFSLYTDPATYGALVKKLLRTDVFMGLK
jgi:hypothetical protein